MELSVREWMIIIGVLLIVAVLLDGYRRVRNERRHRIKVSLSRQAYKQAFSTAAADSPDKSGPNPELPNGGARIIGRGGDLRLDRPVPVLLESVAVPESKPEPQAEVQEMPEHDLPQQHEAGGRDQQRPDELHQLDELCETDETASPADTEIDEAEVEADATHAGETARSRWSVAATGDGGAQAVHDDSCAREVLVIYVLARDKGVFKGQDLLQILLACDLRFGKMNIFHRHEKANGRGAIQFSVANLTEPGTFDLDRIDDYATPGVCLFLSLPGPEAPYKAFDYMVETANVLVKHLNGELRDEAHSAMTAQTLEHCRQRIRDFERRQLTLHL